MPWKGLIALIEPHYPKGEGGRPAYPLMAMLRVHLMQNWFGYSDPAMEESLYETTILRQFAGLHLDRIPDETTILNFRRLLENMSWPVGFCRSSTAIWATEVCCCVRELWSMRRSFMRPVRPRTRTVNATPKCTRQRKEISTISMKSHIGVDVESGLVHSVVGTAANVADVTQVDQLLHGEETYVSGDAGYTGVEKRAEHQHRQMIWSIAARPSSYKKHAKRA